MKRIKMALALMMGLSLAGCGSPDVEVYLVKKIVNNGEVKELLYDENGMLESIKGSENVYKVTRDDAGKVTEMMITFESSQRWEYKYDQNFNKIYDATIIEDESGKDSDIQTFTYDENNRVIESTVDYDYQYLQKYKGKKVYTYDDQGLLKQEELKVDDKTVMTKTNDFKYNDDGLVVSNKQIEDTSEHLEIEDQYEYNDQGWLIKVTSVGKQNSHSYKQSWDYQYDELGYLTSCVLKNDDVVFNTLTFEYEKVTVSKANLDYITAQQRSADIHNLGAIVYTPHFRKGV